MNNQYVRANWKLIEDFPPKDGHYLVAFENSSGEFVMEDCEVWEFRSTEWLVANNSSNESFPSFYIDLTMPKLH